MKLIKPSFEILEQNNILEHIERCGRVCYKSEDKITKESAPKFVDMLINRGHTACLEHGTIYLKCKHADNYLPNKYSNVTQYEDMFYITTNYRVLLENNWMDDLKYQCDPTEHHVKRVTVKFICDRGVSHEFVRHRIFSFCQESSRYCNYSKDKFNNECTFVIPSWLSELKIEGSYKWNYEINSYGPSEDCFISKEKYEDRDGTDFTISDVEGIFFSSLYNAEVCYFNLLNKGWIAQQARAVLPNALKTELIMTGTIEQWKEFFKLRGAKDVHPQARELASPLHEEFKKKGWIE